jgi:hypothetical protein
MMRLEAEGVCVVGRCALWHDDGAGGSSLTRVMQVHSCAITIGGGVKCWGDGQNGRVMLHADACFCYLEFQH